MSCRISGYDAQINKAIAVLQELSSAVKTGRYTGTIGKPNKLVIMGFSFGSYTTHGAIATKPDIADAVILTAIGFNMTGVNGNGLLRSFVPRIASLQNQALFGSLDSGYVTWVDKYALINK
jgi:alpha-beta hydrolase superfamily lysophospholipase